MRMIREILRLHYSCDLSEKKNKQSFGLLQQELLLNTLIEQSQLVLPGRCRQELDDDDRLKSLCIQNRLHLTGKVKAAA